MSARETVMAFAPSRYAPWLDRSASVARIAAGALPPPRVEAWKYTRLERWYASLTEPAWPPGPAPLDASVAQGTGASSMSSGVRITAFEDADATQQATIREAFGTAVDYERHPLGALNDALLDAGVLIEIDGAEGGTLTLDALPGRHQHLLIVARANARATLVEPAGGIPNRTVECIVERGARVEHVRLQPHNETTEYQLVTATVHADATYVLNQYSRGSALRRNDILVDLQAPGARAEIRGGWFLEGREHLDNQVAVHHNAADTVSEQLFHGAAAGSATAVFNGRIYIAPHAQRSDAHLTNKNLLLSDSAMAFTKPELEIYANDVRCAHGATVGQLDRDALFFLRARGIDETAARAMLLKGFLDVTVRGDAAPTARRLLGYAT